MKLKAIPVVSELYEGGDRENRWILQEQKHYKRAFWRKGTYWKFIGSYDTLKEAEEAAEHIKKEPVYF